MMKKILIVTDSCYLSTGFSTVAKNVYKLIKHKYETRFFSTIPHIQREKYPINYTVKQDYKKEFSAVIKNYKPDLVISITDLWRLNFLFSVKLSTPFTHLAYVPVEGKTFPKKVMNAGKEHNLELYLDYAERVITYSEFGMEQLKPLKKADNFIYHGVDRDIFRPVDIPPGLKKRFLGLDDDVLVFLCVGDNMIRKRYDVLLKAWKKFITAKTKAALVLLTHPISPQNGWNLPELINRYGINSTVFYLPGYEKGKGVSTEELVMFYNIADCFILLSAAEGFGLPYLEAMSCGTPVIYTDFATPAEFIGDSGIKVKIRDTYPCVITDIEWAEPCIKSAVNALRCVYEKPFIREKYSSKSLEKAKQMEWKNYKNAWINEIESALKTDAFMGVLT